MADKETLYLALDVESYQAFQDKGFHVLSGQVIIVNVVITVTIVGSDGMAERGGGVVDQLC